MECDTQFNLLKKILALATDFAEHGYRNEAHQLRLVASAFNDEFLIIMPQE